MIAALECTLRIDEYIGDFLDYVLLRTGYRRMLQESRDVQDESRLQNLDELLNSAREFTEQNPSAALSDYLDSLTLMTDLDRYELFDLADAAIDLISPRFRLTLRQAQDTVIEMCRVTKGRCDESAMRAIISRLNAGMSSGLRLVTRSPSTTTSASVHLPPALRMSVLSDGHDVR